MRITSERWAAARRAFRESGDRFADLLCRVPDPEARATRTWSVAQTAAHMQSLAWLYTTIVRPGRDPARDATLEAQIDATDVDGVRDFNDLLLRRYIPERDLDRLAERLRENVDTVIRATDGHDPAEAVPWLGGSRLPLAGLLAHLTNEMHIHGWDIARASRTQWTIPPREAALFFELFLLGVTSYGYGGLLDSTPRPPARRIAVQFRSKYTEPMTMVLDGTFDSQDNRGRVTVEDPRPDNDVRLYYDPPTLNLMLFGRISPARAALSGKVRVGGPRPWLLYHFLRTVHMPKN